MDRIPSPPPALTGVVSTDPDTRRAVAGSRGPIWMVPAAVARPRHIDEVAAVVAWCAAEGLPLTPRGAGTGMPGGNVGRGLVLDLTAMDGLELRPDGAMVAGAGAVAATADALARERSRHFPALPSSAPWCTFGGMISTDAAGARTFSYGPAHRWTDALRVVMADGSIQTLRRETAPADSPPWAGLHATLRSLELPAPPAVRKNVSGYAVDRFIATGDPIDLIAGSEGTLVVVAEGTFRTEPLPESQGVALVGVPELDALPELTGRAESSRASACEYFGRRLLELGRLLDDPRVSRLDVRAGALLVEYAGSPERVAAGLSLWDDEAITASDPKTVGEIWGLRHAASPSIAHAAGDRRSIQFIEDAAVPRSALPAYLRGVQAALDRHGVDAVLFGHAGDGHLHINPLIDLRLPEWKETVRGVMEEVIDLVAELGGTLSGEHGDGRIRAGGLARIWSAPHCRAFRAVKAALDPQGLLNPGVVLGEQAADPLEGLAEGPDLQRLVKPILPSTD